MKTKKRKILNFRFYKEVFMASLALLSVFFVIYEFFVRVDDLTLTFINTLDIMVAIIFLADYSISVARARNKFKYAKSNWYLLLASIPLINNWTELLRAFRLLELVRLVRAGEHISYIFNGSKVKS